MEMTVTVKKKQYKFDGEIQKLKKLLKVIMTMSHDEQWRTIQYLEARLRDQKTIADVKIVEP